MKSRKHCAYNQTRECFLGLEISVADVPYDNLKDLFGTLTLKSGEGLWFKPYRGFPGMAIHRSLDIVFLDEEDRVIDLAESQVSFRATAPSLRASSVLALPAHTIYSSQTMTGDQLLICVSEEMELRLEGLSSSSGLPSEMSRGDELSKRPLDNCGPDPLVLEKRSQDGVSHPELLNEKKFFESSKSAPKSLKGWLARLFARDPRKAARKTSPDIVAHYWTGGAPQPHQIRDISLTGMYVVTEERWYPDTLVMVTLQYTDDRHSEMKHTINLRSRVVRWGRDGIGLQFALLSPEDRSNVENLLDSGARKEELEIFLKRHLKERA